MPQTEIDATDVQRVMNCVRSLVRAFRVDSRAVEASMGLSAAQLTALFELENQPANSLEELAQRVRTHQSSISVVAKRLEQRGLIEIRKSATDRRRITITITQAGRDVAASAPDTVEARLHAAMSELPTDNRDRLCTLFERWLEVSGVVS